MKKLTLILLLILSTLLITACSKDSTTRYLFFNHKEYHQTSHKNNQYNFEAIDGETIIITQDDTTYQVTYHNETYTITGSENDYKVTYPNQVSVNCDSLSCPILNNTQQYPDGGQFKIIIHRFSAEAFKQYPMYIIATLFFILYGLTMILLPNLLWGIYQLFSSDLYVSNEPSASYYKLNKVLGFISCIIGIIMGLSYFNVI